VGNGANVHARDKDGNTPLDLAKANEKKNTAMIECLESIDKE